MAAAIFVFKSGRKEIGRKLTDRIRIGVRSTCDLVLEGRADPRRPQVFPDPIAAAEHCEITCDGQAFWIRDLRTSTGTFVDGVPVEDRSLVSAGGEIIAGAARIRCEIGSEEGRLALTLTLEPHSFHFVLRDTGKRDSDADRMARDELFLGRVPGLRAAGFGATAAGFFLVALVLLGWGERALLQPGPLCASHAAIFDRSVAELRAASFPGAMLTPAILEEAKERGCATCHVSGGGTSRSRCESCHGAWLGERHPWVTGEGISFDPKKTVREWDDSACVACHIEHRGSGSGRETGLTGEVSFPSTCDACHGGTDLALAGFPVPPAAPSESSGARFETISHPALAFSHASHAGKGIHCAICHRSDPVAERDFLASGRRDPARRERMPVGFEICAKCHTQENRDEGFKEWWPAELWSVEWHPRAAGDSTEETSAARCLECHERAFAPELRQVERFDLAVLETPGRSRFAMDFRSHREHFETHRERCSTCHLRSDRLLLAETHGIFRHSVHVEGGIERAASADRCLGCHADIRSSTGLVSASNGLYRADSAASCGKCHAGDEGGALPLRPDPLLADGRAASTVRRPDFPHEKHLDFTLPALREGCFACHEFRAVEGAAVDSVPALRVDRRDCASSGCHSRHENVGGGFCGKCHIAAPSGYTDFFGSTPSPDRARPTRSRPPASRFSHFQPDHAALVCDDCHRAKPGDVQTSDIAHSTSLDAIPYPDERQTVCRDCHSRKRFHWR